MTQYDQEGSVFALIVIAFILGIAVGYMLTAPSVT